MVKIRYLSPWKPRSAPPSPAPPPTSLIRRDPLVYAVALIAVMMCAPFFHWLQWLGDEGVVLHAAVRILDGDILYRDVFEFLPPASFLIVATWMKLFGAGFSSVRVLAISTMVVIVVLLYAAGRLSSGNRAFAALLAIAWITVSPGTLIEVSHHWFTTAASMASVVALLAAPGRAPQPRAAFIAGLFAGIAAMATSTRGALASAAVILTLPKTRTQQLSAVAGIAAFPGAMIAYLAVRGALGSAVQDAILFPARYYSRIQAVPFAAGATTADLAIVLFFPLTFILAGVACNRERGTLWREPRFRTSLTFAVLGLLGTLPRPDIVHIIFSVPLACPLFALVVTRLVGRLGPGARIAVSGLLIGLYVLGVGYAISGKIMVFADPKRTVSTARGPVVRGKGPWIDDLAALVAHVDGAPRGDGFFFYPYSPMLPYLTGRHHVSAFDVMAPGYTTAEQFRDTCRRIVHKAQWVVIERMWLDPQVLTGTFPAMRDPNPPERQSFEAVLKMTFADVVHASTYFELRHRMGNADETLCDTIRGGP